MLALSDVLGGERAAFYRRRMKHQGTVRTAWEGNDLVGVVYVTWEPALEASVRENLPGVPLVHKLHVVPQCRGRGWGAELVRDAENLEEVQLAGTLAAGVDLDNEAAVGFWERLGYREWEYGVVETVKELDKPDGTLEIVPDKCRIFSKVFDSASRA
ncbi:Acetyltransferase (GNAT) family protein [Asanoa hainanensis]|uniref:Acetyltransferase (GNAT) family protein n=2 Tax=Asanoa hainanensis TaxID=560556 RepID=A0A239MP53_9ACTN|nr:Acetyltransferase (GNAT) family protein [Asanoa hainanensis]